VSASNHGSFVLPTIDGCGPDGSPYANVLYFNDISTFI